MTKHDDYQICFENVSFKYPGTDEYVLKNLSLSFNSNKSIALVGENGAGKSTIMKLLTKLYQPTEGKITVNGVNINDVHYDSLSNILSIVYQDFGKYYMTVAENVSFSKEFDEQKVTSILKHSMFRKNLSLNAQLGKLDESGVDLSGGEWQSLAIARALHSDARIICLDEPTASLDPIVESHIYQSFSEVIGSRGSIMISHRLASAIMCEEIIVIDEGSVVEKGSHQQLLDAKGLYQKMFDVQSSWYKEADANER
jgi:ATP-binding cassette subfamily B protein